MRRSTFELKAKPPELIKQTLLNACQDVEYSAFLDSNNYPDPLRRFEWIAAIDAAKIFNPETDHFLSLANYHDRNKDWMFGHLSYELKEETEGLSSHFKDELGFTPMQFFIPKTVVYAANGKVICESHEFPDEAGFHKSLKTDTEFSQPINQPQLKERTSREDYLEKVKGLKAELQYGNIYEINYCIEFFCEATDFNPLQIFKKLNDASGAPFSAYYKNGTSHLICASPERYLQKSGRQLTSQPIKGTMRRSTDSLEDEHLKRVLLESQKERSENVMITDLVRNDLSKTADLSSVVVKELFGVYTFNTVHQLISSIQSQLHPDYHFADALKTTFPMGSMTGAPKHKALELIDEYEDFARGLYSGSVGYITPEGDFDFNVIIRSLFYNEQSSYLSARVGSAITINSSPEAEYEECKLKAASLFQSLK